MTSLDQSSNDGYRRDVDGLRAIAVLLVVAYHAKVPGVTSGFLGVDIFFVISGYVISRLLLRELRECGTLSFARFWRRRVVRLAPAFLLVVATTLIAAPLVLERLSGEIGPLARASLAALGLNANHFFLFESADYFAAATETNPMLHTWSLSVEEQFYLLWPALLLLGWRRLNARTLVVVISLSAAVSLALACWLAATKPAVGFYILPARAWQLLVGVLLAMAETRSMSTPVHDDRPRWRVWLGACLIVSSAILDASTARTLSPLLSSAAVLGTAMLIGSGAQSQTNCVSRLLVHPAVVYLGRISYPVYLWHWPLLVMTRSVRMYEAAAWQDTACVLAAFALGALTHELVEKPSQRLLVALPTKRILVGAAVLAMVLATGAALLGAWTRFGWGYTTQQKALDAARHDLSTVGCIFSDRYPGRELENHCFPNESRDAVLLWGDSHAQHWAPALKSLADAHDVTLATFSLGGCRPLPRRNGGARCELFFRAVAERLREWREVRGLRSVVLSARWAEGTGAVPVSVADQASSKAAGFDEIGVTSEREALLLFEESLRSHLTVLQRLDLRVWLFLPTPNQKFAAPHCLAMRSASLCYSSVVDNERYSGNVKEVMLRVAAEFDNVRLFDPNALLCGDGKCPALIGDTIVYSDDDHLSQTWVKSATPALQDGFRWLIGFPSR